MVLDPPPGGKAASSSLRVAEVDPQIDERWGALVTSLPTSLIYQHPAWLQVLEESYGYKPIHLACEDRNGQLRGILPLFYRRGLRTGRICASLFDSQLGGPLAYDDQARAALVLAAIERTRAEGGVQLRLQTMSDDLGALVHGVVGLPAYKTYLLALPEQPDLVHLNPRIKWAVNKATRLGVHVREAQSERELQAWYGLYLQTMRRLVVMPKPYRFFELAWQRLRPRGLLRLLLAEHTEAGRSKVLSGFLFLQWGQTISHTFTGWRKGYQALRPNDLLHWWAIQEACSKGFRWYDFGDVPVGNQGLAQFKSKWGAEAKLIYHYFNPAPYEAAISIHSQPGNSAHQLVRATWRHLPINAIGVLSNWCYALHYY